jgi:hypothetical protein
MELDAKEGVWTIPAERTKNKLPHEVPLFPVLTELLASIPIIGDSVFKTGRTGDKPLNSFTVAKERLDAAILEDGGEMPKRKVAACAKSRRCHIGHSTICVGRCAPGCPS